MIAAVAAAIAEAIIYLAYMAQWSLIFGGFGSDDDDGGGIRSLVGSLLMIILAPLAAIVIQMAISRAREYDADASGARILGNPIPLAGALAKLHAGVQHQSMRVARPTTAPLYIVNPFKGRGFSTLFSTHPPIEERIARLGSMD